MNSNTDSAAQTANVSPYLTDIETGKRYKVSRQSVWRWVVKDPTFPPPVKLSPGCSRWRLADLEAWESAK